MVPLPGQYWIDGLNSPATPVHQLLYYQQQHLQQPAPDLSTFIAPSSAASSIGASMYPSAYMWQQPQPQRLPLFAQRQLDNGPMMHFPPPSPQYTFNFSQPALPPRSLQDDIAMLASRFTGQFAASSPAAVAASSSSTQIPRTLPHRPRPGPLQPRMRPRSEPTVADPIDEVPYSPTLVPHKASRKTWTAADYKVIIDAHVAGDDIAAAASNMTMPMGTARRIIRQYEHDNTCVEPKQRGGPNHVIYDRDMVMTQLLPWLQIPEHVDASLDEIRDHLTQLGTTPPSRTTLAKWLEGEPLFLESPAHASLYLRGLDVKGHIQSDSAVFIGSVSVGMWSKRTRPSLTPSMLQGIAPFTGSRSVTMTLLVAVSMAFDQPMIRVVSDHVSCDEAASFAAEVVQALSSEGATARPMTIVFATDAQQPSREIQDMITAAGHRFFCLGKVTQPVTPVARIASELHAHARSSFKARRDETSASENMPWELKVETRCTIISTVLWAAAASELSQDKAVAAIQTYARELATPAI